MTEKHIEGKQGGGFFMEQKIENEILENEERSLQAAIYYVATTITLQEVAGILDPALTNEQKVIVGAALGQVAKTILETPDYETALKRRQRENRGPGIDNRTHEEHSQAGSMMIEATGTEHLVRKRGQVPWTSDEVAFTLAERDNQENRLPNGYLDVNGIMKKVNAKFHAGKEKQRTNSAIRGLYYGVDRGKPRGEHRPPKNPKYLSLEGTIFESETHE